MTEHFNKLTPAQLERFAFLSEELGEVQQEIGKILRHGLYSVHPDDPQRVTNAGRLAQEVGHVSHGIDLLIKAGDIDEEVIMQSARIKAENIKPWLHHQEPV